MAKKSQSVITKNKKATKPSLKDKKLLKTTNIVKKTTKIAKKALKSKKQAPKIVKQKAVKDIPKIQKTKAAKAKKSSEPYCPKGYNAIEYEKFKTQTKILQSYSNVQLKQTLKKNLQSMSGNKDQMINKIADGIVLGRIPRCPNCFGGRPKFDYKAGTYHCSGYRDDVDFKNCHTTFSKDDLKRDPWE